MNKLNKYTFDYVLINGSFVAYRMLGGITGRMSRATLSRLCYALGLTYTSPEFLREKTIEGETCELAIELAILNFEYGGKYTPPSREKIWWTAIRALAEGKVPAYGEFVDSKTVADAFEEVFADNVWLNWFNNQITFTSEKKYHLEMASPEGFPQTLDGPATYLHLVEPIEHGEFRRYLIIGPYSRPVRLFREDGSIDE